MKSKNKYFILALLAQLLLLLIIPVPRWVLLASGKSIVLETIPYDPYNIFRGYYAELRYEISETDRLPKKLNFQNDRFYYVVLAEDDLGVWRALDVLPSLPDKLATNHAVIKGRYRYGRLMYGIEQYYLPEGKRLEVEKLLREANNRAFVELKVNRAGEAAILHLKIAGKKYKY